MIDPKRKRTCHRTLLCQVMLRPPYPFQIDVDYFPLSAKLSQDLTWCSFPLKFFYFDAVKPIDGI
jgi:hypothetical protein